MAKKAPALNGNVTLVSNTPIASLFGNVERVEGGLKVTHKRPRSSKMDSTLIALSNVLAAEIGETGSVFYRANVDDTNSWSVNNITIGDDGFLTGVVTDKDGNETEIIVNASVATVDLDEEEEEAPAKKPAAKKPAAKPAAKGKAKAKDEDDEDEDDEDEEEEAPKKTAKKPAAKGKAKAKDEDEDDEDDADDEDEDEEEEAPKKSAKKPAAKKPAAKGKKAADDEEDDDFDF